MMRALNVFILLGGQQYYITVRFKNMAGQDVLIRSSDNNPDKGWKVKKGYMMDITKGTTSAEPVTLIATSTDGKTPMAVNGTTELQISPHVTKSNTKDVVVLGTQRELVMVYIVYYVLRSTFLEETDTFSLCKLASTSYVFTLKYFSF